MYYTPQNKLRVTQWTFPYVVHWVSSVVQTRQDIEKRFSASYKGAENKAFSIKNLVFKMFVLSFEKFAIFAKKIKIIFISFLLMSDLCVINGSQ